MNQHDVHQELLALTKATIPYRASYQECAYEGCQRAAVGSYCQICSEEIEQGLQELEDARECPHDRVRVHSDNGTKYAECEDCNEGMEVDWKDYDGDIL